jgi:hypothetical protein
MKLSLIAAVSALVLAAGAAEAGVINIVVPGTADPFLAGAGPGGTVTFDTGDVDTAPDESPVGIAVTAGQTLHFFNVTGAVSNGSCCTAVGPGGGAPISSNSFTAAGFTEEVAGFTDLPINSLVGVFVDPSSTNNAVFEIGSGGNFVVPTGVTELYLGTVDGYQWNNNFGAFNLSVVALPEPATWAMMLLGLLGVGTLLRASRRQQLSAVRAA